MIYNFSLWSCTGRSGRLEICARSCVARYYRSTAMLRYTRTEAIVTFVSSGTASATGVKCSRKQLLDTCQGACNVHTLCYLIQEQGVF